MSDKRSLTKGVFHLALAKQYLEDYKRDCVQSDKRIANGWVNKTECVLSDIYFAMTEASRQQYLAEVKNADILIYDEIFRLTLMMDKEQRELLETIANGIVNGELIEFEPPK